MFAQPKWIVKIISEEQIHLKDFNAIFTGETTSVPFYLLSCATISLERGSIQNGNNLAPRKQFFPFILDPIWHVAKELCPLQMYSIPYSDQLGALHLRTFWQFL